LKLNLRASVDIPIEGASRNGLFCTFDDFPKNEEHFAILFPQSEDAAAVTDPLVRVHSECVTGDVFGSMRCDCGAQLQEAIRLTSLKGGCVLYMRQEGRGIGFNNKMDAYVKQDEGYDTYAANSILGLPEDARSFEPAAAMLQALGFSSIRLLTNNPDKIDQLRKYNIEVSEVVSTGVFSCETNIRYLEAKKKIHKHQIALEGYEA